MSMSKVSVDNTKITDFFYLMGKITQTMVYSHFRNHSRVLFAELVAKASCFDKNKIYRW